MEYGNGIILGHTINYMLEDMVHTMIWGEETDTFDTGQWLQGEKGNIVTIHSGEEHILSEPL